MKLLDRFRDEQACLTHTAPERFQPGRTFQWREGHPVYRITRVRQIGPTRLLDGGAQPCWEVRGVQVTPCRT